MSHGWEGSRWTMAAVKRAFSTVLREWPSRNDPTRIDPEFDQELLSLRRFGRLRSGSSREDNFGLGVPFSENCSLHDALLFVAHGLAPRLVGRAVDRAAQHNDSVGRRQTRRRLRKPVLQWGNENQPQGGHRSDDEDQERRKSDRLARARKAALQLPGTHKGRNQEDRNRREKHPEDVGGDEEQESPSIRRPPKRTGGLLCLNLGPLRPSAATPAAVLFIGATRLLRDAVTLNFLPGRMFFCCRFPPAARSGQPAKQAALCFARQPRRLSDPDFSMVVS